MFNSSSGFGAAQSTSLGGNSSCIAIDGSVPPWKFGVSPLQDRFRA